MSNVDRRRGNFIHCGFEAVQGMRGQHVADVDHFRYAVEIQAAASRTRNLDEHVGRVGDD